MAFQLVHKCADGTVLLKSAGKEPVARPQNIYSKGKKAGIVLETVGRISRPLFVARLYGDFPDGAEFD